MNRGLLAALVLASTSGLTAQTAPAPSAAASAAAPSETIRLNPFEVSESVDDSFVTHSVGTGGRLVLDLKDVPAQYSVINRAFIDALGITDMTEAASWAPGQSFNIDSGTGAGAFDGQYGRFMQRGLTQVTTPNTTGTSGSSNGVMRNFYQNAFSGNQDSYLVESFDFGQGPNGILFGGAGSTGQFQASGPAAGLAGVSSSQTKRTRFDRSTTSISAEIGAFQYKRFTLDYNRPITDRIGVRINVVDLDSHLYNFHGQDMKRGLHLTTTWKISPTAELTVEGSIDKVSSNRPSLAQENFSGWDGSTVARGLIDTTMIPTTVNNNNASLSKAYGSILGTNGTPVSFGGEPNGVSILQGGGFGGTPGNDVLVWNQATNTVINWRGRLVSRRADNTSRTPLWSKSAPNGAFYVRGTRPQTTSGGITIPVPAAFGVSNRSYLNYDGLPGDMYDRVLANSKARLLGLRENLTWDGDGGTVSRNHDVQWSFAKSFSQNFAFGLGGDWNVTRASGATMDRNGGANTIYLDLNQVLPDGTPNDYYLQMFSQSGADGINDQNSRTEDKALRANVHYAKDFGKWGNYVFNLNGNANTRTYDFQFLQVYITQAPNDPILSNLLKDLRNRNSGYLRMQMYQTYSMNLRDGKKPMELSLINSQWTGTGTESNTNAFTPTVTKSTVTTTFGTSMSDTGFHRALQQDFASRNLALQTTADWMDKKIVFLGGYRRDYNETTMKQQAAARYYPTIDTISRPAGFNVPEGVRWDGVTKYFKPVFSGSAQEYGKLTYQVRDAAGNKVGSPRLASSRPTTTLPGGKDGGNLNGQFVVDDPRYLTDRFRDDFSPPKVAQYGSTKTYGVTYNVTKWFAPYINKSDQIIPTGPNSATTTTPNLDIFGNLQNDTLAKGTDFGAKFNFLGGRLSGKYNYYTTTRYNNPSGNNVINQINNLINSNRWDDTNTSQGAGTAINQLGITPLSGNGDYSTTGNYGYEWELAAQLAGGLRLTLNGGASSTFTDTKEFYPLTGQYLRTADRVSEFKALLEDAGGSLDTTQKPQNNGRPIALAPGLAVLSPLPGKGVGLDSTNAVNAYNNIWIENDNLGNSQTRNRNSPTMNFFADYRVQSGTLKGLQMGAGIQWQGPRSLGNKGSWTVPYTDPTLGLVAIDDPNYTNRDLIWVNGAMRTQANFSYTFRRKNSSTLAVALRVNNIGAKNVTYGAILRQPEGNLNKPDRVTFQAGNPTTVVEPVNARLTLTYTFGNSRLEGGR